MTEKELMELQAIEVQTELDIDHIIANINKNMPPSRERSLTITKLEEAKMWLGQAPLW